MLKISGGEPPAQWFTWITCAEDGGREHAVLDEAISRALRSDDPEGPRALCGHRVLVLPASLLEPPGERCIPCAELRSSGLRPRRAGNPVARVFGRRGPFRD